MARSLLHAAVAVVQRDSCVPAAEALADGSKESLTMSVIILPRGDGKAIPTAGGGKVTFKALRGDTHGAYSMFESEVPAKGDGPGPQIHRELVEAFYIIEGEVTFRIDDRKVKATAGSFVLVPRGTVHAFSNESPSGAKMLVVVSPGGFEGWFEEMRAAMEASPGGQLDPAKLAAISRKYDTEFLELLRS